MTNVEPPADPLAAYPVVVELPVQWGDMDAFGHVNNTVFVRWFEVARIAYWGRLGVSHEPGAEFGPILASVTCNFRRQLAFPDTIRVGARVARIGRSSLTMEHLLARSETGEVAADGSSVVVTFDYARGTSQPVPDSIRRAIEALEATRS